MTIQTLENQITGLKIADYILIAMIVIIVLVLMVTDQK